MHIFVMILALPPFPLFLVRLHSRSCFWAEAGTFSQLYIYLRKRYVYVLLSCTASLSSRREIW